MPDPEGTVVPIDPALESDAAEAAEEAEEKPKPRKKAAPEPYVLTIQQGRRRLVFGEVGFDSFELDEEGNALITTSIGVGVLRDFMRVPRYVVLSDDKAAIANVVRAIPRGFRRVIAAPTSPTARTPR